MVGALATAEACRLHGAEPLVGGVKLGAPADRSATRATRRGGDRGGAADRARRPGRFGGTRVRDSGVIFAESRMAELLGEETVLVDATLGPSALADGLAAAAAAGWTCWCS